MTPGVKRSTRRAMKMGMPELTGSLRRGMKRRMLGRTRGSLVAIPRRLAAAEEAKPVRP